MTIAHARPTPDCLRQLTMLSKGYEEKGNKMFQLGFKFNAFEETYYVKFKDNNIDSVKNAIGDDLGVEKVKQYIIRFFQEAEPPMRVIQT